MIALDEEIQTSTEVDEKPVKQYYGWGFSGDALNGPFVMVNQSKVPPVAIKGIRLLWCIGAIVTDKPISTENLYEPNVGDVGQTDKGERIEVITANYY